MEGKKFRFTTVNTGRAVLISLLLTSSAAEAQLSYTVTPNNTVTITGYTGGWPMSQTGVIIPATTNGLPVTSIGDGAFSGYEGLPSVTIPAGVTNIGLGAFGICSNLVSVTIPDGVLSIGDGAFENCVQLPNISIPGSVNYLGVSAFSRCYHLTNLTIGDGVPCISSNAFYFCHGLHSIVIPASVTNIGDSAFSECDMTNIVILGSDISIGSLGFYDSDRLAGVYFAGNAPVADVSVFSIFPGPSYVATIYYLPGSTGWSPTFAGVPATSWNPAIKASGPDFGLQGGQFGFDITGNAGLTVMIQACTNLANPVWTPLQTATLTGGVYHFSEPFQPNAPARYYGLGFP